MRITITIEDTEDGQVNVSETQVPGDGDIEEAVTSATALADAMFEVMDQLGKLRVPGDCNSVAHSWRTHGALTGKLWP